MNVTEARDILGVSIDADQDAIKSTYRNRAKEVHPDQNNRPDADEEFKRVKKAKEVLLADLSKENSSYQRPTNNNEKDTSYKSTDQSKTSNTANTETSREKNKRRRERWRSSRRKTNTTTTRARGKTTSGRSWSDQSNSGHNSDRSWRKNQSSTTNQSKRNKSRNKTEGEDTSQTDTTGSQRTKRTPHSSGQRNHTENSHQVWEKIVTLFERVRGWLTSPPSISHVLSTILRDINLIKFINQLLRIKPSVESFGVKQFKWAGEQLIQGFFLASIMGVIMLLITTIFRSGLTYVLGTEIGNIIAFTIVFIFFIYFVAEPPIGFWIFPLIMIVTGTSTGTPNQFLFILSSALFFLSVMNLIRYVGNGREPWWLLRTI